jgi:hypothetical protein
MDAGDDSEASGDDGGEDEERRDRAGSNPWSVFPISYWRDAEGWLETRRAEVSFGWRRYA